MKKAELIFMILCIIAVILDITLVPGGIILEALFFLFFGMFYLISGFALFNDIKLRHVFHAESYREVSGGRIVGAICTGFAMFNGVLSLLFRLMHWPGAVILSITALGSLLAVCIIGLIKNRKRTTPYYANILIRASILMGIILLMNTWLPTALTNFKYRNYPVYLQAYNDSRANPGNDSLVQIMEKEKEAMYREMDGQSN